MKNTPLEPWKKVLSILSVFAGVLNIMYFLFGLAIGWGVYFGNVLILAAGLFLIVWGVTIFKIRKPILSKRLRLLKYAARVLLLVFLLSFILIQGLIIHSAIKTDRVDADYLVILGAAVIGERPSLELKNRLDKGIEYLTRNPNIRVIVSGGQGLGETITEAEAMKIYLVQYGIDENRILKEDKSRNTFENIKFTAAIIRNEAGGSNQKLMIVSNSFHIFRAKLLAKQQGFDAYGLPAETPLWIIPNHYVREYFAVIKSLVFDRG